MHTYHRQYHTERKTSSKLDRQLLFRMLGYLRPYRYILVFAIIILLFAKVAEASIPILVGKVLQFVLDSRELLTVQSQEIITEVIHKSLWVASLIILTYILDAINVIIKNWVGQKALYTLRTEVFNHIQKLPLSYYDKHSVGDMMTRTIHDIDQITQMFSESIIPLIGNLILFICIGIGIFWLDWRIASFIACVSPLVWLVMRNFRMHQRRCYNIVRAIVASMNAFLQEHLMGLPTIRQFGIQKKEQKKFSEVNDDHCTAYMESMHNFSFFIGSIDFFQSLVLTIVFIGLVKLAPVDSGFQAGTYFTFTLYVLMFFRPLADLAERYNVLQSALAATTRIFQILDEKEESGPHLHIQDTLSSLNKESEDIDSDQIVTSLVFDNVWFAYEEENWILKGISFTLKEGESIALVGVTGSGKTTIMSLLLRFYEFQKGRIEINGKDIREYPLGTLRKMFSIVLQDPVIFSGTLAENIALYNPKIDNYQINAAIDYVNLRNTVNRFPNGSQHILTEKSGALSVGEMQLVALGRAVAQNRSVLILDEATANIDTATEKIIQETLQKILKHKTSLVIAHRLSTIQHVTRIIVLHKGTIAESGSHLELLRAQGLYERLYRLQFSDQ